MKIQKLQAENIKIIKIIDINPKNNVIVITGENGNGKTTVLDTIFWALGGTKNIDERPVREGEERGLIRLELDDLIITRRFTQREGQKYTTSLKVINKEGAEFKSPQQMLDKLIGGLNFDPLKFVGMKSREQFDELRKVLKIDFNFEEHKKKREGIYNERTYANRDIARLEGAVAEITYSENTPEELVNVDKLMEEANGYKENNEKYYFYRNQVEKDEEHLEELKLKLKACKETLKEDKECFNNIKLVDEKIIDEIRQKIRTSTEVNNNVSQRRLKNEKQKELEKAETISQGYTNQIKALDELKIQEISKVKMPIEGLELGDGEITHNKLPFAQLNSAKKLEIACTIVMMMEKKLRVIRIENGSLLDDKNLKVLKELAIKHDHQVWIEKVDSSGEIGIFIEEGEVKKVN